MLLIQFFRTEYVKYRPGTSERTVTLYCATITKLERHLGREPTLADLNNDTVGLFIAALQRSKLSTASVNKERDQLFAMWRLANQLSLVTTWPLIKRLDEPERIPKCLSVDQLKALWATCSKLKGETGGIPNEDVIRAVFAIQYTTAERIGAVSQLEWTDIEGTTICFRAETRKGKKRANVKTVPQWVIDTLEPLKVVDSALLFPDTHGKTKLHLLYDRLYDRAKVRRPKGKSSHLLRSTHATFVDLAGGDATKSLRHASDATTRKHYLDPRKSDEDFWRLLPEIDQ